MEFWQNLSLEDIHYISPTGEELIEQWVDIQEFEGLYHISDLGRIKSLGKLVPNYLKNKLQSPFCKIKSQILKPQVSDNSCYIHLIKNGKGYHFRIKNLEISHFTEFVPKNGYTIINLDGNCLNNSKYNLKYIKNIRWREVIPLLRKGISIDELVKISPFSKEQLLEIKPKKSQVGIQSIYKNDNTDIFSKIDSEPKAYWLGFLLADGNVSDRTINITISKTDLIHLEKFRDFISPERPIKEYLSKYSAIPLVHLNICNRKIITDLSKFEMIPNKTFKLNKLPNIHRNLIRHLIRGYFDGDGCITKVSSKKSINYIGYAISILGNKPFLEEIQKYLMENCEITKFSICLSKPKTNQITYQITKGGNRQVNSIMSHLYKDSTIYLERKYEKFILLEEVIKKINNKKLKYGKN